MRTRMFAAVTVALAALSLTACGDNGDGVRDEGASKPSAADSGSGGGAANGGSEPASDKTGGQSGTGSGTGGGNSVKGRGSDPGAPAGRVPCTAANTSVTAAPVTRPLNHMLITVTNTGSKTCDLPGYPILKFEGAQSVPPVMEDSKPQAVTSLKPGAEGYAAAILSAGDGSGGEGHKVTNLQVGFEGSNSFAAASLPVDGVHIDNSLRVTYWLTSATDALAS